MNNKFRVWDKEINDYILSWDGRDSHIIFSLDDGGNEFPIIGWKELGCDCHPDHPCGGCINVYQEENISDRFIIENCIGFVDKNNKDIFEGDLLQLYRQCSDGTAMNIVRLVYWNQDESGFYVRDFSDKLYGVGVFHPAKKSWCSETEIIGNNNEVFKESEG